MDPNNFDLKKELASAPLSRGGFDDKLMRRIEANIEADSGVRRSNLRMWIPYIGIALFAIVLFSVLQSTNGLDPQTTTQETDSDLASEPLPIQAVYREVVPVTAVLLGFRTDDISAVDNEAEAMDRTSSTYRTLLIAPRDGKLSVIAEGSGILMPYGQKFWKINPREAGESTTDEMTVQLGPSSNLLFAGNKYIALEQSETGDQTDTQELDVKMSVKDLKLFANKNRGAERSITLSDIFGETTSRALLEGYSLEGIATENDWSIVREKGKWAAKIVLSPGGDYDIPLVLPEEVTSYDRLCCAWDSIRRIQPMVVDAVSSPKEEMIIVFTEQTIEIYPVEDGKPQHIPFLRLHRKQNESLVLAQWATDSYVDKWIHEAKVLLTD